MKKNSGQQIRYVKCNSVDSWKNWRYINFMYLYMKYCNCYNRYNRNVLTVWLASIHSKRWPLKADLILRNEKKSPEPRWNCMNSQIHIAKWLGEPFFQSFENINIFLIRVRISGRPICFNIMWFTIPTVPHT